MHPFRAAAHAAALASLVAGLPARADEVEAGALVIRQPWARATPGGAAVAAGYVTVLNRGTGPERLVGGSLEAAGRFELHVMTTENGIMRMRPAGPLTIPPGGTLTLSPSGTHIMFSGLKHGLKSGDKVGGTLVFEHAGTVRVTFKVEGIGARQPPGTGMPAMPGMTME